MSDITKYIEGLNLASASFPYESESLYESLVGSEGINTENQTYLNYKSINSFVSTVSSETREDVLNSFLLAQRAATKAFPNEDQSSDWYKKYFEILSRIGWVVEHKNFTIYKTSNKHFEIDKIILNIIGAAITGNQLAILTSALEAFKNLGEDDRRLIAFSKNTHTLHKASFQIGIANETNGAVSIDTFAFVLESKKIIQQILFFTSTSNETKLEFNTNRLTLNQAIFADARDTIKQKLGDVNDFIVALDI